MNKRVFIAFLTNGFFLDFENNCNFLNMTVNEIIIFENRNGGHIECLGMVPINNIRYIRRIKR